MPAPQTLVMKRTPAKPGRKPWQKWDARLTVEYGPLILTRDWPIKGQIGAEYAVFLDGTRIGKVTGTGKHWRLLAEFGARPLSNRIVFRSRTEATAELVDWHQHQGN
jgi:hypothetical protein